MKNFYLPVKYLVYLNSQYENGRKYIEYLADGVGSGLSYLYKIPIKFSIYSIDGICLLGVNDEICNKVIQKGLVNKEEFRKEIGIKLSQCIYSKEFKELYFDFHYFDISDYFVLPFGISATNFLFDYSVGFFSSLAVPLFIFGNTNITDLNYRIAKFSDNAKPLSLFSTLFTTKSNKIEAGSRFINNHENIRCLNTGLVLSKQMEDIKKITEANSKLKFGSVF